MRDLGSLLGELDEGEVEKLVLTQRNRLRAVVVSVERWSEAEKALARIGEPPVAPPSDDASIVEAIRREHRPAA